MNNEQKILVVQGLYKSFDDQPLLRGISFEIARGEIVCLLGPSGGGKSTLLRLLAGLERAERGKIIFENQDLEKIPTHRRGIGLMFQDLALFPHRNVFDNIAFGLRMQKMPRADIAARVREMLKLVGLENFGARNVHQLSGGEQQRVALARALAPRPRLLLFDEPLGALDRILREQLQDEMRAILKSLGITALYVTHDQAEGFAIADRVLILHTGDIAQSGTPRELYEQPANAFVARFLGLTNLLPGTIVARAGADAVAETAEGKFRARGDALTLGARVVVLLRAEAAERADNLSGAPRGNEISGRALETRFGDGRARVTLTTARGTRLMFALDHAAAGDELKLRVNPRGISFLRE